MATLHLLSHPNALNDCLNGIGPDDLIVLLAEGVYLLAAPQPSEQLVNKPSKLFVLAEDATIRGMTEKMHKVEPIDYAGLVELCTQHQPIVSWG